MTIDENTVDDTLFDMNKKKKSKKRANRNVLLEVTAIAESTDNMAGDAQTNDVTNGEADFSYEYIRKKLMKKKGNLKTLLKTKKKLQKNNGAKCIFGESDDEGAFILITRAFDMIRKSNGTTVEDHQMRIILPPPKLARYRLRRQEKILYNYFVVELGTSASIDANHALIIKGRLRQQQIENILCSFIKEYVTCKTCHSPDTLLKKEERLTVINCHTCHSQYTVSNIRTGFQAQIGRRSHAT